MLITGIVNENGSFSFNTSKLQLIKGENGP